jgi:hypothetical protein
MSISTAPKETLTGSFSVMSHGCFEQSSILRQCKDDSSIFVCVWSNHASKFLQYHSFWGGPIIQENEKHFFF